MGLVKETAHVISSFTPRTLAGTPLHGRVQRLVYLYGGKSQAVIMHKTKAGE